MYGFGAVRLPGVERREQEARISSSPG